MRSPAGEEIVLVKNVFVERLLPGSVLRALTPEEMERYRTPYRQPGESRRPTLTWPRQIPLDGEPADVVAVAGAYAAWLGLAPLHDRPQADQVDPGQLDALLDEEAADRLHAPLAEADVVVVGPPGVRVALEVHGEPLVRLELLHERRERGLRGVGQAPLVE